MADDVFIYSSNTSIRGINISLNTENFLTSSPFATGLNAVATNTTNGLVYYGSGTTVYRWNPALGGGAAAHQIMNNFATGPVTAPIQNINSTSGSYLDGKYYVGSEASNGYIEDLYELQLSADGRQVLSATALNLPAACSCTGVELGGFGDVAAFYEGSDVVLFASTGALSAASTMAGRWKLNVTQGTFTFLSPGNGGQMSNSTTGALYSNLGNDIRTIDKVTGIMSGTTLFTTSEAIYDFSSGYAIDFSDAPDTYGSAFHVISATSANVYLGSTPPDNEAGPLNSTSGSVDVLGDDNTGIDDEDAVNSLPDIQSGDGSYSISTSCTAGTPVSAWIDLNRNGVFDSAERNSNYPVTCANGTTDLIWDDVSAATGGDSFVRIRTSTDRPSIAGPTGRAPDGEVEDHPVTIFQTISGGSCPVGSTALTYMAEDLPLNIGPDRGQHASSYINVAESATIVDVNVLNVIGTHTNMRDLIIDLRHNGSLVRLERPSCSGGAVFNVAFDDEATSTPPCPPDDGNSHLPERSLSAFDGGDAAGEWRLRVRDTRNSNAGQFTSWGLEICIPDVIVENPDIIVGKAATVVDREVNIMIVARNSGDVDLDNVQITDDLDATFGAGNYTVQGFPQLLSSPAGYTADVSFTGSGSNTTLVSGNGVVPPDGIVSVMFTVLVDSNNTATPELYNNQAIGSALSPQNNAVTDASGPGLDTSTDTDAPTVISMEPSPVALSGHVFYDTSTSFNTSHDGVFDAAEAAQADRLLNLFDANSNVLLATVITNGEGLWRTTLDASYANQPIRVQLVDEPGTYTISEAPAYTTGSINDGVLIVVPQIGVELTDIDIGVITSPLLTPNQSTSATAGSVIRFAHTYVAPSHGSITAAVNSQENPGSPVWPQRLVLDANCNGNIDVAEMEMTGTETVIPEQTVCFIVDVFVPSNVAVGATLGADLTVNYIAADPAAIGHGFTAIIGNLDNVTATASDEGQLELVKTVRNASDGEVPSVSNAAAPGETLEYIITYTNTGSGSISDLMINDTAPAYTSVQAGTVQCANTPSSVSCTPAINGDDVEWEFSGSLGAGESGQVRYSVLVE
ncbi:MAG: DUF11 domain-containing protein [Gammaproteobacteria bacterium]|nr:DUF11 domain-containing protein [Gammaproteobacteria bacterium]